MRLIELVAVGADASGTDAMPLSGSDQAPTGPASETPGMPLASTAKVELADVTIAMPTCGISRTIVPPAAAILRSKALPLKFVRTM
ncbi:MAG: hypothetical protein R3C40_04745 [Parvularculaceae bacterium]